MQIPALFYEIYTLDERDRSQYDGAVRVQCRVAFIKSMHSVTAPSCTEE